MSKFIMLVGIPASGKDTWGREYVKKHPYTVIHSSDDIREELYGDASVQIDHARVFIIMQKRTIESFTKGFDVIYNATNIAYKDRKGVLSQVKQIKDVECICKIFVAPVEVCKERNSARERSVPDYVYDKMLRRWQTPCEWEGFDNIDVIYTAVKEETHKYIEQMKEFDQKNHHHQYTLGEHCFSAAKAMLDKDLGDGEITNKVVCELAESLLMHDVGKLFTQTGPDEKGDCHYINHENFGAYIMLSCGLSLFGSQLTTYHMYPYMKDEKGVEVWRKRMGHYFCHWLDIFHECDMKGH